MTAPTATRLTDWVAGEIRAELGRRGMTALQLAELLGVSRSWISYRLTGQQTIDLDDIERIMFALDLPITALLPLSTAPESARRRGSDQ